MIPVANTLEGAMFATNPAAWFRKYGRIKSKKVLDNTDDEKPPKPNSFQERFGETVWWCLKHNHPINIVIVKPRQKGSSTLSVEIMYVLSRCHSMNGIIVGGKAFQCNNLWEILDNYQKKDTFNWTNTFTLNQEVCRCSNGSSIKRATAGTDNVGKSGTFHFAIITELAHWPSEGKKAADDALHSILACVPKNMPGCGVIMESTGNGPEGTFPDAYNGAVEFEEAKAGKRGNGYIRVSACWYEFTDSRIEVSENDKRNYRSILAGNVDPKDKDEKALIVWDRMPQLEVEQIAYYHQLLNDPEINGDPVKRDRHYPCSVEDAFSSSNPSLFDSTGLDHLERVALHCESNDGIVYGCLERVNGTGHPTFVPCSKSSAEMMMIRGREPGIVGRAHLISVDNMTGESHVMGADPDTNSVLVLGAGFMDHGQWNPFEPIVSTLPDNRWDPDILADFIARLSEYYGRCMVIPERNRGEWLISALRKHGVLLREMPRPAASIDQSKGTGKFGYQTDKESKPALVACLAQHIRNPTVEGAGLIIRFLHIIKQLRLFIRHSNGEMGAAKISGAYDDAVMALGIGLIFKDSGTAYAPPRVDAPLPHDIRLLEEGNYERGRGRRETW